MASILRQIVAGPRLRNSEAGLDLCYVTDDIIATSGPSSTYPKRAYRNPTDALVRFLDSKHDSDWSIWEFRAEGTGYPDEEVYNRIHHFPWPDHHPAPFALIPALMASMRNWLTEESANGKRVAVVHCKAGKGRSGMVACSYLISEQGWAVEDALKQFTERRMRSGFGAGVSIQSQVRWVGYVDRWANELGKKYVERPVEIVEIHISGLRDGIKVEVDGFVDGGRKIKRLHRFHRNERTICDEGGTFARRSRTDHPIKPADEKEDKSEANSESSSNSEAPDGDQGDKESSEKFSKRAITTPEPVSRTVTSYFGPSAKSPSTSSAVLRPQKPLIVPTSDVNIDFERRSIAAYTGWTMVTSIARIWFNAYFEGGHSQDSGTFEADWDELDGIKGTASKGIRGFDHMKVVWRYPPPPAGEEEEKHTISEPGPGEAVPEGQAADWRGQDVVDDDNQGSTPDSEHEGLANIEDITSKPGKKKSKKKKTKSEVPQPREPSGVDLMPASAGKGPTRRQSAPQSDISLVTAPGNVNALEKDGGSKPKGVTKERRDSDPASDENKPVQS